MSIENQEDAGLHEVNKPHSFHCIFNNLTYLRGMEINNTDRIKLVVIDEHTLGYIMIGQKDAFVLHTSILKGSYLNPFNPVVLNGRDVRLATEEDFKDYRVLFEGYNEEEYEWQK